MGSNDGESRVANAPNADEAEDFCTEILLRCINVLTCTDGAALMNEVLDCVEAWLNVGQFCPPPAPPSPKPGARTKLQARIDAHSGQQ